MYLKEDETSPSELLNAGRTEEALTLLESILTKNPDAVDASTLVSRALALTHREKPKAAFELMKWTSQKYPELASVYDAMAESSIALNDHQHAIEASQKVLEALKTDFSSTASWRVVYKKRALKRLDTAPFG